MLSPPPLSQLWIQYILGIDASSIQSDLPHSTRFCELMVVFRASARKAKGEMRKPRPGVSRCGGGE
jgi:hypothetical protein